MLLDAKEDKSILIVSVYQSCNTNTEGHNTFHLQQKLMMSMQNRADVHPRRNFLKDLSQFLKGKISKDPNITPILLGDWNESMRDDLTACKLAELFGLVDVWEHNHDEEFPTYSRGRRRIDFALTTPTIASHSKITYEPFHSRLKGDHRAFYIECIEKDIFGNQLDPITNFAPVEN